jgi:hypothetical protein
MQIGRMDRRATIVAGPGFCLKGARIEPSFVAHPRCGRSASLLNVGDASRFHRGEAHRDRPMPDGLFA